MLLGRRVSGSGSPSQRSGIPRTREQDSPPVVGCDVAFWPADSYSAASQRFHGHPAKLEINEGACGVLTLRTPCSSRSTRRRLGHGCSSIHRCLDSTGSRGCPSRPVSAHRPCWIFSFLVALRAV